MNVRNKEVLNILYQMLCSVLACVFYKTEERLFFW